MKQVLIIINGLRFPHHLAEHSISRAREQSASLLALFLAGDETEEGYIFPSDLNEAQNATDKEDAEQSGLQVIRSQMRLIQAMAKSQAVTCKTELLINPALNDVLSSARNADVVFVDTDHSESGLMSVTNFNMKDIIDQLPSQVEKISGKS